MAQTRHRDLRLKAVARRVKLRPDVGQAPKQEPPCSHLLLQDAKGRLGQLLPLTVQRLASSVASNPDGDAREHREARSLTWSNGTFTLLAGNRRGRIYGEPGSNGKCLLGKG